LESFVLSFSTRTPEASKLRLCPFLKLLPSNTILKQLLVAARLLVNVDIDPAASQYDISEIITSQASRDNISLQIPQASFYDVLLDLDTTSYNPDVRWAFFTTFGDWHALDGSFHKGAFYMRALRDRFQVETEQI
jgi:hypothetical protein